MSYNLCCQATEHPPPREHFRLQMQKTNVQEQSQDQGVELRQTKVQISKELIR
jgi:hypothetical protein